MPCLNLVIRPEQDGDSPAIENVVEHAFRNAAHASGTERFIVRHLRVADALAVSLVALCDEEVAGYVAVSPVIVSDGSPDWLGLGPVAVLPRHQGLGIGSQLVREALRRLRNQGAAGCVVLGEPAYYGRFGFLPGTALRLEGVPSEYFQQLPFGGKHPAGTVTYHPAFAATS